MRTVRRLAKAVLRPFYRAFFEKPLWWFLGILKSFFFAETTAQLSHLELQLREHLKAVDKRLEAVESASAAQWDALEQLLLALARHPESGYPRNMPHSAESESAVHVSNHLR